MAGAALLVAVVGAVVGCGDQPAGPGADARTSSDPRPQVTVSPTVAARHAHTLVLTATGTATVDAVTFVFDGETTQERSVVLPWSRSLDVPADGRPYEWRLTVEHGSGEVRLVATLDDRVLAQSAAGGDGKGTVSISGSVAG